MLINKNANNQFEKEINERKTVIEAIAAIVKDKAYEQILNVRFYEKLCLGLTYVDEYIKDVYDAFEYVNINKTEELKKYFDTIEKFINNKHN